MDGCLFDVVLEGIVAPMLKKLPVSERKPYLCYYGLMKELDALLDQDGGSLDSTPNGESVKTTIDDGLNLADIINEGVIPVKSMADRVKACTIEVLCIACNSGLLYSLYYNLIGTYGYMKDEEGEELEDDIELVHGWEATLDVVWGRLKAEIPALYRYYDQVVLKGSQESYAYSEAKKVYLNRA